jgi:hypothetical protein
VLSIGCVKISKEFPRQPALFGVQLANMVAGWPSLSPKLPEKNERLV